MGGKNFIWGIYDELDFGGSKDYKLNFSDKTIVVNNVDRYYNEIETSHNTHRTTFNFRKDGRLVYSYGVGTADEEKAIVSNIMENDTITFHNNRFLRMC